MGMCFKEFQGWQLIQVALAYLELCHPPQTIGRRAMNKIGQQRIKQILEFPVVALQRSIAFACWGKMGQAHDADRFDVRISCVCHVLVRLTQVWS